MIHAPTPTASTTASVSPSPGPAKIGDDPNLALLISTLVVIVFIGLFIGLRRLNRVG